MRRSGLVGALVFCRVGRRRGGRRQGNARQAPLRLRHGRSDPAPDRALLDRYCVTCHNARLKTAGLTLDDIDID